MRARVLIAAATALALTGALPASAHGIGGRADLPVPLTYFLVGGGVVLVLSFAALAVLWPDARMQGRPDLRSFGSAAWINATSIVLGGLGIVGLLFVVTTGLFGVDNSTTNPSSVLLWVGFWLVIPFLSAVLGNLYRHLNPWRTLSRWLRIGGEEQPSALAERGMYVAAALFVAFTWLELVYPDSASPRTVAIAALVYSAVMFVSIDRIGRRTTSLATDAFGVYNGLFAGIAPITTSEDGRLAWRGWLRGLPVFPEVPGLAAFLVAMIGTVTFDGLSGTPWYDETFGQFGRSVLGGTVLFLLVIALIGAGYVWACKAAARIAGDGWTTTRVADRFAHTLVPIALAYAFAHYFTLVLFEGQYLLSAMSDPFGTGLDLFGTADRSIDSTVISPTAVWWVQVAAIILGHVAAVVLAHDRALGDFPKAVAVRTQYAMLGLMVGLTGIGLSILAAG